MALIVQKYGGTSVGDTERIKNVARRIIRTVQQGHQVVVTVSAMGHTTDELIDLAQQVNPDPSQREMDMLLSTGEQVSIALVAMAIQAMGQPAISLTGAQVGIYTENAHSKARIMDVKTDRIQRELKKGNVVVVAGFQGITGDVEITTLGRGGSDTTAVAVAAALKADVCEIYTDVDGIYTTDPRIVAGARKLKQITYDEMLELASLGAQVLHPRSVELAKSYNMALHVRSSFKDEEGTIVKGETNMEIAQPVSGVALDMNQAKLAALEVPDKPGVAANIFGALAENQISVDMIIQSIRGEATNDIAFTVAREDLKKAVAVLEKLGKSWGIGRIVSDENIAKVSIVGAGMIGRPGIAAKMFDALGHKGINIQMISTSEIKVSCVIAKEKGKEAVEAIHQSFKLEQR